MNKILKVMRFVFGVLAIVCIVRVVYLEERFIDQAREQPTEDRVVPWNNHGSLTYVTKEEAGEFWLEFKLGMLGVFGSVVLELLLRRRNAKHC